MDFPILGPNPLTTNTANSYLHKIDITIHLCHSLSPNLPGQNQHRFSEIMFPFPQNSTAEMQKSEQSHLAPSFTLPLSISCQFKNVQIIAKPKCLNMVIDNHSQPWIFFFAFANSRPEQRLNRPANQPSRAFVWCPGVDSER